MDHEAVVYDLDGTLVRLAVDWSTVDAEVADVLRAAGGEPNGRRVWGLLDDAEALGVREDVESIVADHEREGARGSRRLPLADEVADVNAPVGVCSLNCEAAVRIALDQHGLADHVDAVVGRDSVPTRKPHPEPLRAVTSSLGADPERSLFVGDSPGDRETADRAGAAFRSVERGEYVD